VRKPPSFSSSSLTPTPLINPVIYLMNVNQAEFYAVDISARPKPIVFPARALKRATEMAKGLRGFPVLSRRCLIDSITLNTPTSGREGGDRVDGNAYSQNRLHLRCL